ncbi:J domain-containing protein [Cytophagaceae bacterium YF14B1]|uniref:J domain-containing protein n=1 Tax=Xanthocytophaga flava TaxID=3048013 RepID=A0AAE3UA84_9BACT|nr:J domain-containing protein [Xanthocytophaga flavus]MDJ1485894.1 J domain-containing protein [Xanthocytophaga flavus]
MIKDYYKILALKTDASLEEIKKAYRAKALQFHPDTNSGSDQSADLFLEVKEAYQILSDPNARSVYDQLYTEYFPSKSDTGKTDSKRTDYKTTHQKHSHYNSNTEDKDYVKQESSTGFQTNEKYHSHQTDTNRNTHTSRHYSFPAPFYSPKQRSIQQTPKKNPVTNHWGESLAEDSAFFTLPEQIGLLVSGYTDLKTNKRPFTKKQIWHRFLLAAVISCLATILIILLFKVEDTAWRVVWTAVPLAVLLWLAKVSTRFEHINTFIGVNGFASYSCQTRPDNIIKNYEINFQQVTDLVVVNQINKRNFTYQSTSYCFLWFDQGRLVLNIEGEHYSEDSKPERTKTDFWLNTHAQNYWTIYLLDNLEARLKEKGFIEFNVFEYSKSSGKYKRIPYIRLGEGFITFLSEKGEITYTKPEIKKVYTRGSELFIEHVNFQKKFFFFESGNKNGIPLLNLSNRGFFLKAFEILLGYQLS